MEFSHFSFTIFCEILMDANFANEFIQMTNFSIMQLSIEMRNIQKLFYKLIISLEYYIQCPVET